MQDYLDDKLQSAADLESLDTLLESVKAQQDLLKKQVGVTEVLEWLYSGLLDGVARRRQTRT